MMDDKRKAERIFGCTLASGRGKAFLDEALNIVTNKLADKEGIYRFSPSLTDMVAIQNKMNNGEHVDLGNLEPNMITGLVKCYFRELQPEPVIPFDSYESLIAAVQEEHYQILIMGVLDEVSYDRVSLLSRLCHHLHFVASKKEVNKMPVDNLAIVWAQNLLKPRVETPATILGDVLYVNDLVSKLIEEADFFFSEEMMQKRKGEWEQLQASPEAMKRKEEERKEKQRQREREQREGKERQEREKEETRDDLFEVRYRPPKSLTYKAMRLHVSYEGGIKLTDNKAEEHVKEHYTADMIRWVSCPVADTVSIDLGSNRALHNGFLIVKTPRAKTLEHVLNDIKERCRQEEMKRRLEPQQHQSNLKWNADEEVRRRRENKRKINDEWMVDFIAKKPTSRDMSIDDRKQLRQSLTVRYAMKKKENPVRAAVQEMQLKDNKMADFFNTMVFKIKSGNYTLKQLDAWLKWIGNRIFNKGAAADIPKELLEMEAEEEAAAGGGGATSPRPNGGRSYTAPVPMAGGGSGIARSPAGAGAGGPGGRPIAHSSPHMPAGRSAIVKSAPSGGNSPSSPIPMGRSVIVRTQQNLGGVALQPPSPSDRRAKTVSSGNRSDDSVSNDDSPTATKKKSATISVVRPTSPPSPIKTRPAGIASCYPSATGQVPQLRVVSPPTPPGSAIVGRPPPVPHRDNKPSINNPASNNGHSSPSHAPGVESTSPPNHPTNLTSTNIANGKANIAALINGRSAFIPRNRTDQDNSPPLSPGGGSGIGGAAGLSAMPQGSKSVRPKAPPRNPAMKLSREAN